MATHKNDKKTTASQDIEAVLFDFGGVLAEEGFREGLETIGRSSGVNPAAMARTGFDLVHRTGYVTGRADEAAFWRALRKEGGARGTDEELRREILSRFVVRPWMIDIADRARASGRIVGILSDQTQWLDEIDRVEGLFRHFDHVFNSYHTGVSKRDPAAFERATAHLRLPPRKVLFVDDHPGNVERARAAGLVALLYTGAGQFLAELSAYVPSDVLPAPIS